MNGGTASLVSVCVPAHRDHSWFRAAMGSVLAQTYRNVEVIVADDSGGALRPVVSALNDSRVRYLANPQRLGLARNHCRAIVECSGAFIAFLHDDDLWEPDYLRQAVAVMEDDLNVGLVICGVEEIDGEGTSIGGRPSRMEPGVQADALGRFLEPDFMLMIPSAAVVRRTALAANTMPWPDVITGDVTLFVDVAQSGWSVHFHPESLVRYRMHREQTGGDGYAHRDGLVTVWGSYRFADPSHERVRRSRLSRLHVARAGALLRRRDRVGARADLRAAIRVHARSATPRWLLLWPVALVPGLADVAERVWRVLHDPYARRHEGT